MTVVYTRNQARLEGWSETLSKKDLVEIIRQQDEVLAETRTEGRDRAGDVMTDIELWSMSRRLFRFAVEFQDNTFHTAALGVERAYQNRFGGTTPTGDRKVEEYKG